LLLILSKKKGRNDIEETQLYVPIFDLVSLSKIKSPCRSKKCQHINVFDLDVYLNMNSQMPQWKCPICNQNSKITSIYIDGYFKSIIDSLSDNSVTEVSIHPDGRWAVDSIEQDSNCKDNGVKDIIEID